eukprot:TRINITY_DN24013_c0_g1_i2.p1 TRINITY_DN24013_c0_g1~~TRINITY_DN24013_c0_g1_i2.p1  ORF type:complete len:290 (+),score=104.82 TRINITY_DN24013_c0_g1_i2:81-872(+)
MASVDGMSVSELKDVIRRGGLGFADVTEKSELVQRAKEAAERIEQGKAQQQGQGQQGQQAPPTAEGSAEPTAESMKAQCQGMSVSELKATIRKAGLSFVGLTEKPEMVARAAEALVILSQRKPSFFEKPLGTQLLTKDGLKDTSEVLQGKDYVLLYFSAHWCPPCRQFTPMLANFHINESRDKSFEVVFISNDKSESQFDDYFESMPWTAVPFDSHFRGIAQQQYGAQGIPELVVLSKDGEIIRRGAVQYLAQDQYGRSFPWH